MESTGQTRDSIVDVTSMVASKGVPGSSVYAGSTAAVESLTRTWAPAPPCTPTVAATPSDQIKELIMTKSYGPEWKTAVTVVQHAQPPHIADGAEAMTVVIEYPPGSAGTPGVASS